MPLGFRLGDLILCLILALLIFGPHKLPEIGTAIGKAISSFKNSLKGSTGEIDTEETVDPREQRNLEIQRMELQVLEHTIAIKQLELEYHQTAVPVKVISEETEIETPTN